MKVARPALLGMPVSVFPEREPTAWERTVPCAVRDGPREEEAIVRVSHCLPLLLSVFRSHVLWSLGPGVPTGARRCFRTLASACGLRPCLFGWGFPLLSLSHMTSLQSGAFHICGLASRSIKSKYVCKRTYMSLLGSDCYKGGVIRGRVWYISGWPQIPCPPVSSSQGPRLQTDTAILDAQHPNLPEVGPIFRCQSSRRFFKISISV